MSPPNSFYARWRVELDPAGFQETGADGPPENLLQAIWQHQRLRRDDLHLSDGRPVRILHPGFWNHEAGPDFRKAVVRIADEAPVSGDLEVDLNPGCWKGHRHHQNPNFGGVILHVVWEVTGHAETVLPTLALKDALDSPLSELALWLNAETARVLPDELAGKCSAPLRGLTADKRDELLQQAALVRLQSKAAQIQGRARDAGWEQALWEGLFRALGYKHNTWPMQSLAELRPRMADGCGGVLHWQARLFGTGGLLPAELPRAGSGGGRYLRQVWDLWWRDRDVFADHVLPGRLWHLGGLRPANHPQRRLALASHWLGDGGTITRLEKWFMQEIAERRLAASLLEVLQARDEYWGWHWTFRSERLGKAQPLLGEPRATDLAMNVILPWFWVRADDGGNEQLRRRAEARYLAWPAGEDNSVLKQTRQRLFGSASARWLKTAGAQQGLLQIVRDFCDHANALCDQCRFPELVRQWREQ